MTLLFHPDLRRIGERLRLDAGSTTEVARDRGAFGTAKRTLDDPFVSRQPLRIKIDWRRGVTLAAAQPDAVRVAGSPLSEPLTLPLAALERGVVVTLSSRVVLCVHLARPTGAGPDHGLVGDSPVMRTVRDHVDRVADLSVPVLLRGETGVGKDLVARAIHRASARADKPCVCLNMGAMSPTTAVSELFGHVRGAFTGATSDRPGLFETADGGTLFLDEIGVTPDVIQPMLLRVLETGEYLPVGADTPRRTDVRVIAATDTDLELAEQSGTFRAALLHRLSGYEVFIPPLRDRITDIPALVLHFLDQELPRLGEVARLDQSARDKRLWFRASLMRKLIEFRWPGNVRQLRNAVRQLLISSRGEDVLTLDDRLASLLAAAGDDLAQVEPVARPGEITEDLVYETMRAHGWAPGPTASALAIPRTTLYGFIEKSPRLRTAKDVSEQELRACYLERGGDLDAMSEHLEVSKRGIKLRLCDLDLIDQGAS